MICLSGHQNVICFIVGAKGVGGEVVEIHRINFPPVSQSSGNTCQQCENDVDPMGALRFHRKSPSRLPAAPRDTSVPLLSFDPGGVGKALPRRACPDENKDTRCTNQCQLPG